MSLTASPLFCTPSLPPGHVAEEGEDFTLHCSTAFTGDPRWAPVIEWGPSQCHINNIIDNSGDGRVDVIAEITAEHDLDGCQYAATLLFKEYDGILPPNTAINVPDFTETYTFDPLMVQCEYH